MAKKSRKRSVVSYEYLIVPSAIGALIAWVFSGNMTLGIVVFFAVWVGNYISSEVLSKKK